ncbi:imidazoleglycerol-phosphate dehydratase HisB [Deinococcus ruber]|uniref:Imidazoleglycerol-phosphate dehydratase n=1 Tax=Deinococcus ruber TaxID=1848197 RepID=A0A918BZ53_9DEIO|nr:imidazoleglycerol-phosphate dehydratase HisB [Deinococcus ruber]GGQ98875.1 imidazoleglycerol-phosphate dehydratase [Deinococcus ruber]
MTAPLPSSSDTSSARRASIHRHTHETDVQVTLDLSSAALPDGNRLQTGHGFLDHMLEQLARHGRLGLSVQATGDLHVEVHHLAEDVGITVGQALAQALGNRQGIERYGSQFIPMDETLAHVVVDLSGRAHLAFEPEKLDVWGTAGDFSHYHLREFLRGLCNHAGITLHVRLLSGREAHHVIEAIMKAFARALRDAVAVTSDSLPSTKGLL